MLTGTSMEAFAAAIAVLSRRPDRWSTTSSSDWIDDDDDDNLTNMTFLCWLLLLAPLPSILCQVERMASNLR
jgi:hypothetical protein